MFWTALLPITALALWILWIIKALFTCDQCLKITKERYFWSECGHASGYYCSECYVSVYGELPPDPKKEYRGCDK